MRPACVFLIIFLLSVSYSASQAAAGDLKWKYQTGGDVASSPAIGVDGTIYVGSGDSCLYALNPSGSLKWKYKTGYIYSSPAIGADGTIYIGASSYLYALNPDGSLKWKKNISVFSSPAIGVDGTIYVCSYFFYFGLNFSLYALNPDSTLKWKYDTEYVIYSSPAVGADGTIYMGTDSLYALNPDGSLKWKNKYSGSFLVIGADGTIYMGANALNPDGSLKWKTNISVSSSPAIGADGTIYVGSSESLCALNPDGSLKWSYRTGDYISSSPAVGADGTIYVGSQDDNFYALNPDGTLKWKYQTGGDFNSSPTIGADGTVYVGSNFDYLYAFSSGISSGLANSSWPELGHDPLHTGRVGGGGVAQPAAAPEIALKSTSVNLDSIITGGRSTSFFVIDNFGTTNLVVSSITSSNTAFTVSPSSGTIPKDDSLKITVSFSPAVTGTQSAAITIKSNDSDEGTVTVTAYGTGTQPGPGGIKWKYPTGGPVRSSPAVGADGTIYIGSNDWYLYALNPDGSLKWEYPTEGEVSSSPAVGADGTIYVGNDSGYVHALNSSGALKWKYQTGGQISSSPALGADGTVYFGVFLFSWDNYLYALGSQGALKWKYQTGDKVGSSPAVGADGTIYVGSNDYNLYALNPDGSLKWKYLTGGEVYSSPAIGTNGIIYLGPGNGYLYALNPDGSLKWRYQSGSGYSSPVIGLDGTIIYSSYIINPDGTRKGSLYSSSSYSSPAIGADSTIYVGSGTYLYAMTPRGSQKWRCPTKGAVISSPAIGADGTIYIGSDDTYIYGILSGTYWGLAASTWPKFHHDLGNSGNTLTSIAGGTVSTNCTLPGDVTGNGTIDISDVISIVSIVLGQKTPTAQEAACADINVDRKIDIFDILSSVRKALGKSVMLAGAPEENLFLIDKVQLRKDLLALGAEPELIGNIFQLLSAQTPTLPKAFSLRQNSPNPFNPSTTISYSVPEDQSVQVSLKVYDLRGRLVCTLVNEERQPGTYSVFWDGRDESGQQVSSGVYLYRMRAGEFTQTRKMVLVK